MAAKLNYRLFAFAAMALILAESAASRQMVYGSLAQLESSSRAQRHLPLLNQLELVYGVEADLVLGMMKTESGFDAQAVSGAGALGLMQLMPLTAQGQYEQVSQRQVEPDFFRRQLLDQPDLNIFLAVQHLAELERVFAVVKDHKKRRTLVLAAYNAGYRHVMRAFGCLRLNCVGESVRNMTWRQFRIRLKRLPGETRRYIGVVEKNRLEVQKLLQLNHSDFSVHA